MTPDAAPEPGSDAERHPPPPSPARALPQDPRTLDALHRSTLAIIEGLDLERTLIQIVEEAREVTGARYGACGVPDAGTFRHFVFSGISEAEAAEIGDRPQGRGLLGELLTRHQSLRLERLADHPAASGFPPHHPPMTSFLGVPVLYHGRNIGDIYLTDKANGTPFSAADEQAVEVLAGIAALAITNAHQFLQVNQELERRRQDLDDANRTLQALSNRVLWMLESERRQLAQELHDGLGQVLAAGILAADAIAEGRSEPAEGGARIRSILRAAVADVRRISHGLRPTVLDELGPVAAIRDVVEQLDSDHHGRISFEPQGVARRLPEPVETVIYRVAQEALTNVVRHSGASKTHVTLAFTDDRVTLTVSDNGIGMPPTAERGLGIVGMRERAALVSGEFRIESRPGHGVTVTLDVPGD